MYQPMFVNYHHKILPIDNGWLVIETIGSSDNKVFYCKNVKEITATLEKLLQEQNPKESKKDSLNETFGNKGLFKLVKTDDPVSS